MPIGQLAGNVVRLFRAKLAARRRIIEQIEVDWAQRLGEQRFQDLCQALQALVDELDPRVRPDYVSPPR